MNPYTPSGFWLKAKLFINRALEDPNASPEDERRMWAALSLELLAKWALAEISPTLVIDPVVSGGDNILSALDLKDDGMSITASAKTVFIRCEKVFRPFNKRDAENVANARNDYLHGSGVEILALPNHAWWPKYWSLVNILLISQQRSLEDFVGFSELQSVNEQLKLHNLHINDQYKAAIQAARRNLKRAEEGSMSTGEKTRWDGLLRQNLQLDYRAQADCPACGSIGEVQSDYAESKEVRWDEISDDPISMGFYPLVEVTFEADFYICPRCHLILNDPQLLKVAGFDEPITIETDEELYLESEYGND